jgi:hypothetical protein
MSLIPVGTPRTIVAACRSGSTPRGVRALRVASLFDLLDRSEQSAQFSGLDGNQGFVRAGEGCNQERDGRRRLPHFLERVGIVHGKPKLRRLDVGHHNWLSLNTISVDPAVRYAPEQPWPYT